MNKPVAFIATFVAAFALGAWYTYSLSDRGGSDARPAAPVVVTYSCADGKKIWAKYRDDGTVSLSLSDDLDIALPQTVSASGARYATADESFVFWSKGSEAWIEKDGEIAYKDCAER